MSEAPLLQTAAHKQSDGGLSYGGPHHVRYYIRIADKIEWADRPEDLMQHLPRLDDLPPGFEPPQPISVTFIPATRRFETIAGRVQAAW